MKSTPPDYDVSEILAISRASTFWRQAFALRGSVTPHVLPNVLIVGAVAATVALTAELVERRFGFKMGLPLACYEFTGAALGLLLVLRTNAGYDRWWEARKLWGGIVNQCRNLAISATAYGPSDPQWQVNMARWVAAFPHVAKASLRGESIPPAVAKLVGQKNAEDLEAADHMPSTVALHLAKHLRRALDSNSIDHFAFMQLDKERATLIDHVGACERIRKTPLALVYSIKIRRFIATFLLTLPFALLHEIEQTWLIPLITMLVAYPLLSLDQIGVELQNPFDTRNLSHLPLDEIAVTVQRNVCALAGASELQESVPMLVEAVAEPPVVVLSPWTLIRRSLGGWLFGFMPEKSSSPAQGEKTS